MSRLRFLARFKDACNHNEVSEGAALWCMQYFLTGQAASLLQSRLSGATMAIDSQRGEMLTSYPEAVNFLLMTYATDDAMAEALLEVEGYKKSTGVTETEFSNELWRRALRCGTVFSGNRLKGIFVEGVLPSIRTQLRNHATDHPKADYETILRFAKGLGSTNRAIRRVSLLSTDRDTRKVQRIAPRDVKALSIESSEYPEIYTDDGIEALALEGGSMPSAPTTPTYSGTATPDSDHPKTVTWRSEASGTVRSGAGKPRYGGNYPRQYGDGQGQKPRDRWDPNPTRCRLCLSPQHLANNCPHIGDPATRKAMLEARERNYQELTVSRGYGGTVPRSNKGSGNEPQRRIIQNPNRPEKGASQGGNPVAAVELHTDDGPPHGKFMPIPGEFEQPSGKE